MAADHPECFAIKQNDGVKSKTKLSSFAVMAFACKQIVSLQAYTGSAPTCNSKRCTTICKAPSLQSQRPFLGRQCSTSSRIEPSIRRNIAAPVQSIATVDNYVADVPVAGEKVWTFIMTRFFCNSFKNSIVLADRNGDLEWPDTIIWRERQA